MPEPIVQIVLSTYNGERYLREQLDSILAQSYTDWQLLTRDDGSSDATGSIIEDYRQAHPDKIRLITGGKGGDSSTSFMAMLPYAQAPYVMFCDQDDVWLVDKVASAVTAIQSLESQAPMALHFTDMQVVDSSLEPLHSSFFSNQRLLPEWSSDSYQAFVQSCAAGCSMIFTQALIQGLHPIQAPLFQHDHWLLMHAAYYGQVSYSLEPSLLYRQHGDNVLGAHAIDTRYFFSKLTSITDVWRRWRYIQSQFEGDISIIKLMRAKWKVNRMRLG